MARRTKAEAMETRESLLDAAERVFLERGYVQASLEEIARSAGVTRGALYWHFRNKADVLEAMLARVELPLENLIEELESRPVSSPLGTLRELCLRSLLSLAQDRRRQAVYTIVLHRLQGGAVGTDGPEVLRRVQERALVRLEALFQRARDRGELTDGISPRTAALGLKAYMLGIFSSWLGAPERYDLAEEAERMLDIFFRGLPRPTSASP